MQGGLHASSTGLVTFPLYHLILLPCQEAASGFSIVSISVIGHLIAFSTCLRRTRLLLQRPLHSQAAFSPAMGIQRRPSSGWCRVQGVSPSMRLSPWLFSRPLRLRLCPMAAYLFSIETQTRIFHLSITIALRISWDCQFPRQK